MIFYWSLSDSYSPQVSRNFLSILVNLNNAIVLMVFTYLLIFKPSCLLIKFLGVIPSTPITIGIIVTFLFYSFLVLKLGLRTYLSFYFLLFLLCDLLFGWFYFFCLLSLGQVIRPRLGNLIVSQNPKEFVHLILLDGFRIMLIPLVLMIKFKFLAQFSVDYLHH